MPASRNKNIRRLDVAVHNAFSMRRFQRISDLDGERQQSVHLQRATSNALPQCHAIQKLHGDERLPIMLTNLVNRADVGMIQRRRRPRLPPEALQRQGLACRIFRKKLQRHQPPQRSVLGLVDDSHAAAAQLAQHAIVRDCLPRDGRFR